MVIECKESVEVYDAADLIIRMGYLIMTVNEKNFSEWYGTMSPAGSFSEIEKLSPLSGRFLTLVFRHKNKRYTGLIKATSVFASQDREFLVDFQGIDLLRAILPPE